MSDQLAVDLYAGDGDKNLDAIAADPTWSMIALKFTQGTYYTGAPWVDRMWPAAKRVAGERYGKTWFRVPYHYLDCGLDGRVQGDYFLGRLRSCGGLGNGDPFVMVDVERASQRRVLSRAQIVACARTFVSRVREITGLRVVVYGGEYLRSNGIHISEFGCEYAWVAAYTAELPSTHYTALGIDVKHMLAWQYAGVDGQGHADAKLNGYPHTSPAGNVDISAITLAGGGAAAIAELASWCTR